MTQVNSWGLALALAFRPFACGQENQTRGQLDLALGQCNRVSHHAKLKHGQC